MSYRRRFVHEARRARLRRALKKNTRSHTLWNSPAVEQPKDSPSLFNRRRKPKDKKSNDLFNPDDEDYL